MPHEDTRRAPYAPAMTFDPDAAAAPGSGIFGLTCTREESRVVLVPVPFDATTSYRRGTAGGPEAILKASMQVDLYDRKFGRVYERGICMLETNPRLRELSDDAGRLAEGIIEQGGVDPDGPMDGPTRRALDVVNAAGGEVAEIVSRCVAGILKEGKIPGVIGGEHSVPFGAIDAVAAHHGKIGLLHLDAHMDLRNAFEGFRWSHASIMHNVLCRIEGVTKLVQVGIRDFGEREMEFAQSQGSRVEVYYDDSNAERLARGGTWPALCDEVVSKLPEKVYVSFDIDGLDPSLCPHTGTPVPGGMSFHQAVMMLESLRASGRKVVGFDLVEVAPGPDAEPEWDANVGARLLYKLCGMC